MPSVTSMPTGQTKPATYASQVLYLARAAIVLAALYLALTKDSVGYTLRLATAVAVLVLVTVVSHVVERGRTRAYHRVSLPDRPGRHFWAPMALDILAVLALSIAVLAPPQVPGSSSTGVLLATAALAAAASGWSAAKK